MTVLLPDHLHAIWSLLPGDSEYSKRWGWIKKEFAKEWLAGGGIKPGTVYGKTDELGYYAVEDPMHVNDLHATILHLLGLDHQRLTFKFQGRQYRLTDVAGNVAHKLLS